MRARGYGHVLKWMMFCWVSAPVLLSGADGQWSLAELEPEAGREVAASVLLGGGVLPASLTVRWEGAGLSLETVFALEDAERGLYRGAVPGGARGLLRVSVADPQLPPLLVQVREGAQVAQPRSEPVESAAPEEPVQHNPYRGQVSGHEPVYFSIGMLREVDARFQFSFRYRFLSFEEDAPGEESLESLYFGYTQVSVWDIAEESAPFHDTNFKPSLFYDRDVIYASDGVLSAIDLQTGVEHESTGRGGADSRSINILYLKPTFVLGERESWHLEIEPKIYLYVGDMSDNPDIYRYRGYADLLLRFGAPHSWQLASTFRLGKDTDHYSLLLDLSVPIDNYIPQFKAYLHLQYFRGWGETLIDYNQELDDQFRIGLMLYR